MYFYIFFKVICFNSGVVHLRAIPVASLLEGNISPLSEIAHAEKLPLSP